MDGAATAASAVDAAARAAHANGVALLEARGLPLFVDVLAGGTVATFGDLACADGLQAIATPASN